MALMQWFWPNIHTCYSHPNSCFTTLQNPCLSKRQFVIMANVHFVFLASLYFLLLWPSILSIFSCFITIFNHQKSKIVLTFKIWTLLSLASFIFIFFIFIDLFIWLCWAAHRLLSCSTRALSCSMQDLVPRAGVEPGPPALGAWSLNHWTTREVPSLASFKLDKWSWESYCTSCDLSFPFFSEITGPWSSSTPTYRDSVVMNYHKRLILKFTQGSSPCASVSWPKKYLVPRRGPWESRIWV